jgi:hypothetical protein
MEKSPRSHSSNILLVTYSWSELDLDSHRIFSRDFLFEKFEGLMKCIWKVKAAQFELIFFFFDEVVIKEFIGKFFGLG